MAQNEITAPVRPRPDPNGRDLRPAHEVIASPIDGHDYSYHPQAAEIQNGLAMKRLNAGQPAAGMRIGAPAPAAQQQPGNVGVANAYAQPNLPEPGRTYGDDEAGRLSVPKGWGTGEISIGGGPSMHIYSDPARTRAHQARVGVQAANDRAARQRQQVITSIDSNTQALMNEYYGGRASLDQVSQGQAALGQYAAPYLANDAAHAEADAQHARHFDPRSDPAYMSAMINQMNAGAERDRAEANNHDPQQKLDLLQRVISNPGLAEGQGALESGSPDAISQAARHQQLRTQIGVGGVNPENVGDWLSLPENVGVQQIAQDQGILPFERLARLLSMPGGSDANSNHRKAIDALVHQNWPTREAWEGAINGLPAAGPGQTSMGGWAGPLLGGVLGPIAALGGKLTGTHLGTGHWQHNADLLAAYRRAAQATGYEPSY